MDRIKITAKQAHEIAKRLGIDLGGDDDGRTFYATNSEKNGVYSFDTKSERDAFVNRR